MRVMMLMTGVAPGIVRSPNRGGFHRWPICIANCVKRPRITCEMEQVSAAKWMNGKIVHERYSYDSGASK
jgi:hypothetical protein